VIPRAPARPVDLVLLDLDGTLIDDSDVLDRETATLLRRASKVVPLAIATGRPVADALRWAAATGAQYLIPLNGAALIRLADRRRLWQAPGLPPRLLARLAALGRAYRVTLHLHALDAWYVERPDPTTEPYAQRHGLTPVVAHWRTIATPVLQAELLGAPDALAAIRAILRPHCVPTQTRDARGHYLDVSAPGVDKAGAATRLLALLDQSWRGVLAIGNGENDVPLFTHAGTSLAVAHSEPALLDVATHRLTLPAGGRAVQTALRAFLWRDRAALTHVLDAAEGRP
jgi:hypothetical protein